MANNYLKQTMTLAGIGLARLRFVAVFVIAALVIGYWDNIKNHVDKWTRPPVAPDSLAAASAGQIEFYCPMHPEVIRDAPGQCPKCGMSLVKRKKGEAVTLPDDVLSRVQLTPQKLALGNIQTTLVETHPLHRHVQAVGVLDYDETKLARLSARVAGRADELFVTYTGQAVKRGDPLYSLYSPEVYTAQREYLLARKRLNDMSGEAGSDTKADATSVYNASLQKLALWGMTSEQLDKLDQDFDQTGKVPTHLTVTAPISGIVVKKEIAQGQYLQVGEAPYTVADLKDLWLQIKLYERDIPLVHLGDAVEVIVDALPNETFNGVVAFKAFQLDPQTRTLDTRVAVDNADLQLRPGMFASATIDVPVAIRAAATSASSTTPAPATVPASLARTYWTALQPYLEAHKLLTADKADGVARLLDRTLKELEPLKDMEEIQPQYRRLAAAVATTANAPLPQLREAWKEISSTMIEIGKSAGLPADVPAIKVFRCPMKKALWLQLGDQTANPYYGSEMPTCGSAVESLPRAAIRPPPTRSVPAAAQLVLAIPRSAVIDTGKDRIVYVESSLGTFDMKAVKLGPLSSDDQYPVLEGLNAGDKVATVGTFLVDAEDRLNPAPTNNRSAEADPTAHPRGGKP